MRRIALISGGSSGIGEACVRLFAKDGWAVVFLCWTHPERAQAITDELRGKGLDVAFRTCDIADSEQVNDTVAAILKDYKHIDALVNCAGIAYRGLLTDMPDATWHHLLATDLNSVFYLQRAVLPGMISRAASSSRSSTGHSPACSRASTSMFLSIGRKVFAMSR